MPIHSAGQGILPLPDNTRKPHLRNLLHVPSLTHNLLSVSKLTTDNSVSITFDANGFTIKDLQDHRPLLHGRLHNGLYQIKLSSDTRHTALTATKPFGHSWHSRLGHPNHSILSILANRFTEISSIPSSFCCISCNSAKSHKIVFNKNVSITTSPFELIHTDVWGPAPHCSLDGHRYYVVFIDDYTRYSWIYLMYTKQKTLSKFKLLYNLIKTQHHHTLKALRTDGGGEFTSIAFQNFL
ncbi:Retrovirus-related Pol polyprotein from transposon TNT 1-94 [Dendrobium catenatum]|uniref:Retrovirus-related Pol polyprotein from transposon TNT 1-94 n=1 Tax=Dendrobium catenatum TaxID=906689 RepID=A0A2I0VEP9_9ASPA|nr:Retrovirus-related Pol polyprotein from transposon TNT 1-94 [Dendrobium catenatum]